MTAEAGAVLAAAIYARESKGSTKSVGQQVDAGREDCAERGWTVHGVYQDLVSASRYGRRPREDWARLLADLEAGEFTLLWLWESSRGDRRAEEWLGLLENCLRHGVLIHVGDDGRSYDLALATDWRVLASSGVESDYESRRTRARILRDVKSNAKKGRPHGGVLYGYRRVYDAGNGDLIRQESHPARGPVVGEIITRVAAGESLTAIARDLDRRGISPARGRRWNRASVRKIAMNRAFTGYRQYRGQWIPSPEWFPPLVDEEIFWKAHERLSDPARNITRPGGIRHLLSGIALCGGCGTPVGIYRRLPRPNGAVQPYFCYRCPARGCVSIRKDYLDDYVSGHAAVILNTPAFWDGLLRTDDAGAREARAREAGLLASLRDYRAKAAAGGITAESFAEIEAGLTAGIQAAGTAAAKASANPALMAIYRDKDAFAVGELLAAQPLTVRRDIIAGLYGGIIVLPGGVGRKVADCDRVLIVPKGAKP